MKYRAPLVVAAAAAAAWIVFHPARQVPPAALQASIDPAEPRHHGRAVTALHQDVVVYVAGAVQHPGLYRIADGGRYDDAVREAGGMLGTADASGVNIAQRVHDGDEILVPTIGEPVHREIRRAKTPRRRKASVPVSSVDVNSADADSLASIPGIGPTLAARIVAIRERDGAFSSLDQLLDVAGMTQSRLDQAQSFLRI